MKNISFCFQFHAPFRLKRYRFFEIGQDHYYYDDMQIEEHIEQLVNQSYMPLLGTISDMIRMSHGKFHCAVSVSGILLDLFQQYAPEMIDKFRELADTKCVEFLLTPYAYSFASEYNRLEAEFQLKRHATLLEELFGVKPTAVWNTELLYSDEIGEHLSSLGYKVVLTEGAKHVLSWKSPNYVYTAAIDPKQRLLMRNTYLSDELSFHFSDYNWPNYPMDAEKYAQQIASLPEEETLVNLWFKADTFGIRQNAGTGIFEFLKALPFYALEREIGFMTPTEAAKKLPNAGALAVPYPIAWTGEAKDLSLYNGNDLQQEALSKIYAVAERVSLCKDKRLKSDWLVLQDVNHLRYMSHVNHGQSPYESAYDAFINYMNVLSDFLQLVDEQYPSTIENEELNELLTTINNQEKEIAALENEIKKLKKQKKTKIE